MNKIENQNLDVHSLFHNNYYMVPDYQREYVWEDKQVNQLLEDINEEFLSNRKSEYFIGSIVVCQNQDTRVYEVIDGQQRLTTLFLCICAIRERYKKSSLNVDAVPRVFDSRIDEEGKDSSRFKLELQYENNSDVLQYISKTGQFPENASKSDSVIRILDAHQNICTFLDNNFKTPDELSKFVGYFLNYVKLIQIETPTVSDALKIFETINERGVGLNPMDLLKNLLFRQVKKDEFDRLKTEWKRIIVLLESNDEKHLRYLRYFIMANYEVKNSRGEEIVREDEIYDWITEPKNKIQCNYEAKPFEFVKLMLSNAEAYVNFLNGKDSVGQENISLGNISKLSGSFRQHLILLLAAKEMDSDLFNHFAKQIEVLLFYYVLTGEPTKEFERKFSKWAKDVKKIKDKEELNQFIKTNFLPEIQSKYYNFEHDFLNLREGSLQNYRIMYILAKITQYVENGYLGLHDEKNLNNYLTKGIEKEHILPQKPEADFKKAFGEDYDGYMHSIGNLTLLEKPHNIVAGRDFFESKKSLYKKSKFYLTRSISEIIVVGQNTSVNRINSKLKSFDKWDRETITERQKILLELAKDIWTLTEFGSNRVLFQVV